MGLKNIRAAAAALGLLCTLTLAACDMYGYGTVGGAKLHVRVTKYARANGTS